jgi:putative transposase
MRLKAYKYRLYPTVSQAEQIRQNCGCRRFVYNWGLETHQKAYQTGKRLSMIDLANMLPDLKKEHPWLADSNSQSLQSTLRDLDKAFTRFFKKQADYPKFKAKFKSKESFQVPQHFKIDHSCNRIVLPKLGPVKAVIHREFKGEAKHITVSVSRSGRFFASVLVETKENDRPLQPIDPERAIGLDMGLHSFVTVSTGEKVENPRNLRKAMARIRFLSRSHSKKMKGGRNRERARIRLARQHEKVANRRGDFIHKLTHKLVRESQATTLCVESLNIRGMMGNHRLAGAIGDAAWGEFSRQLGYKGRWEGVRLLEIGMFEPSSRLCPCGLRNDRLTLADREWDCLGCGRHHDRDLLAAQNIKNFGLAGRLEKGKGWRGTPSKVRGAACL